MTRTWAGIFFYSCGTFCVQWVFWGHLETSGVWGQSWEAHGSAPCFSSCSVRSIFGSIRWTTFGYFRGISGFGVADGHDPRCLLWSPLLTCLLWLWRPPNVAPGFASQFLPGHQQAGRSRENWRRNPSRPISGEILRAIQKDSESPIGLKRDKRWPRYSQGGLSQLKSIPYT